MKERLKISVDLDGVIACFLKAFIPVANEVFPGRLPDNWEPYNYAFSDKFTPEEFKKVFEAIHKKKNFWKGLKPDVPNLNDLKEFLCRNSDVDIYYITARAETLGDSVLAQSTYWLFRNELWPIKFRASVIAVQNGVGKADVIRQLGIHYSIDDHPETVIEANKVEGHKAYLLDRSWNREEQYKEIPRVNSLAEFLHIVRPKPKVKVKKTCKLTVSTIKGMKKQLIKASLPIQEAGYTISMPVNQKLYYDLDTISMLKTSPCWMDTFSTKKSLPDPYEKIKAANSECGSSNCCYCKGMYSESKTFREFKEFNSDCTIPNCDFCLGMKQHEKWLEDKKAYSTYVFNTDWVPITEGIPAGAIVKFKKDGEITKVRNEDV